MSSKLDEVTIDCAVFGTPLHAVQFFNDVFSQDNTSGIEMKHNQRLINEIPIPLTTFLGFVTLFSNWIVPEFPKYQFVMEMMYIDLKDNGEINYREADHCGKDATFLILFEENGDKHNVDVVEKYDKNVMQNRNFDYYDTSKYYLVHYLEASDKVKIKVDSPLRDKCQQIGMQIIEVGKPSDLKNPFCEIVKSAGQNLNPCVLL